MLDVFKEKKTAASSLEYSTVEELLLLVGDEDRGYKPEAMDMLLAMDLEMNFPVFEQAIKKRRPCRYEKRCNGSDNEVW